MSQTFSARRYFSATAGAIRHQGRAMLAAAPWSLAAFLVSLPFAILAASLAWTGSGLYLLLAPVNLIAFARVTFAWHRVVVLGGGANPDAARGGSAEARHLVVFGVLVLIVAILARATGDLPYVLYMMMNGPDTNAFLAALAAAVLVVWLPVLYCVAVLALSLPRTAVTGDAGLRGIRAAMPYPRWPLVLALAVLVSLGGFAHSALTEYLHYATNEGLLWTAVYVVLFAVMTFVAAAMVAVAYRDGVAR
ncbi:hypothetical protein [Achromobacter sp. AGC39]